MRRGTGARRWGGLGRCSSSVGFGLDGTWRSELITRKFSRAGLGEWEEHGG
jgi:hypothetical protein